MALTGHAFGYLPIRDVFGGIALLSRGWLSTVQSSSLWRLIHHTSGDINRHRQQQSVAAVTTMTMKITSTRALNTLIRVFPHVCASLRHVHVDMNAPDDTHCMTLSDAQSFVDHCTSVTSLTMTLPDQHDSASFAASSSSSSSAAAAAAAAASSSLCVHQLPSLRRYEQIKGCVPVSWPSSLRELIVGAHCQLPTIMGAITHIYRAPVRLTMLHIDSLSITNDRVRAIELDLRDTASSLTDLRIHVSRTAARRLSFTPMTMHGDSDSTVVPFRVLHRLSVSFDLSHHPMFAAAINRSTLTHVSVPAISGPLDQCMITHDDHWRSLHTLQLTHRGDEHDDTCALAIHSWGHSLSMSSSYAAAVPLSLSSVRIIAPSSNLEASLIDGFHIWAPRVRITNIAFDIAALTLHELAYRQPPSAITMSNNSPRAPPILTSAGDRRKDRLCRDIIMRPPSSPSPSPSAPHPFVPMRVPYTSNNDDDTKTSIPPFTIVRHALHLTYSGLITLVNDRRICVMFTSP